MPNIFNGTVVAALRAFVWLSCAASILLGGSVLAGWLTGNRSLETVRPGLAAMSPLTAMALMLAGAALGAHQLRRPAVSRAAALVPLAIGLAVLGSHLMLGRDALSLFVERSLGLDGGGSIGRTAPATAGALALLGAALLATAWGGRLDEQLGRVFAVPGLLVSALALLGYAYGVEGLYAAAAYRTTALHTAIGLFTLFLACLVRDPEAGWAAILASGLPSGRATRTQLILATALPFLAGLLMIRLIRAGAIAPSLGMAVVVAAVVIPLVAGIFRDGRILDAIEMERFAAAEAQLALNETLEQRVRERTGLLAASEARFRTYFENAPEGLALFRRDDAGRFVFDSVNPAFRDIYALGGQDPVGLLPGVFTGPADGEEVQRQLAACLASGQVQRYRARRVLGGSARTIDVVLAPVPPAAGEQDRFVVGSMRDVTDADLRDEQLRQAQKMEAVGQLTGGIAHDFNNLLAGMAGSLEMLERRIAQGRHAEVDRYVTAAQGGVRRAAALIHRLLAFSRRQTLEPRPTDVNTLVAGLQELVQRAVGPQIVLELKAAAGLWTTLVDPNQLENALLNLCINARDAMPDGGRLVISTANERLSEAAGQVIDLPQGDYVSLCVRDDGVGMPPGVAERAFDPFFTTKPIGEGTGLGLSMIHGFCRQSGGQARIVSEPGRGTTVCLHLPRHLGEAVEQGQPLADGAPPRAARGESVLLVDDEPTVRMLVADVLAELGYHALEAGDGAAGLQVLRSDARIDLLVTDVGLPGGLNGRQVADAGRVLRPGLKVLFITGYAENAVLGRGQLEAGMHVMTKPFAMDALAARIQAIIAAGA